MTKDNTNEAEKAKAEADAKAKLADDNKPGTTKANEAEAAKTAASSEVAGKGAAGNAPATPATNQALQSDQIIQSAEAAKKAEGQDAVGSQTADNSPATGGGDHANIAAATQDPKNANVVTDNQAAQPKVVGHDDPKEAGTQDYVAANEGDVESDPPSDEVLDAMDRNLGYRVGESQLSDTDRDNAANAAGKIVKMLNLMPKDAKDSFTIYGYGGVILSLGDLRQLLRGHPDLE